MTGDDLRRERTEGGLTQAQLAQRIGRGVRMIRYWESGDRQIPIIALPAIAAALRKQPVSMATLGPKRASDLFAETATEWDLEASDRITDGDPAGAARAYRLAAKHREWAEAARKAGEQDPLADPVQIE